MSTEQRKSVAQLDAEQTAEDGAGANTNENAGANENKQGKRNRAKI